MPRKSYPFGRSHKGHKEHNGHNSYQAHRQPSLPLSYLEDAMFQPEARTYRFCLIYDQKREELEFMQNLNTELHLYRATTTRLLPAITLTIYQIAMSDLEQAVQEEKCSRNEFVQSQLHLIYKVEPCASVVAVGSNAQKLLQELKLAAADRPDRGERFLLLDEIVEPLVRLQCHGDPAALQRFYRQVLIRRIHA